MSRRLEIELTSERPDGSWTWRAAGAKQPKGDLDGSLLPEGTAVGAVLRVEADFLVDGIEIVAVLADKAPRPEPERLEILGSGREEPLVTTQLAPKGRGGRGRGRDQRDRRDRDDRRGGRDRGPRSRDRGPRPDPVPERPTPKRLRPGRAHRQAVLDEVPAEQRPIAEQVLQGGVPAVRDQAKKQNEKARAENRPELPVDQVVAMAEQLLPRLREAEWRDRAEAAVRDLDELDLRDLRSVVVAADSAAGRDEEARALREQLSEGLTRRVAEEHENWLADMNANLDAGRFVRALRISSRPPKAGTPLPPELTTRLVVAVSEGLNASTKPELYAATLDALSFSPVRTQVVPSGRPAEPGDELMEAARRVADKVPSIPELFGVDPKEANAARRRRSRDRGRNKSGQGPKGRPGTPKGAAGDSGGKKPESTKPDSTKPESTKPAESAEKASEKPADAPVGTASEAPAEEKADTPAGTAPDGTASEAPAEEKADTPAGATSEAPAEEKAAEEKAPETPAETPDAVS